MRMHHKDYPVSQTDFLSYHSKSTMYFLIDIMK